jgi:hypothetical protein
MSDTKRDNAKAKAKKLPWGDEEKYELLEEAHGPNYFSKECKAARNKTERQFRRSCKNKKFHILVDEDITFPKVPRTQGWETH